MKLLFLQSTGLGDRVAEAGSVEEIPEQFLAQEFVNQGRAVIAPGETELETPTAVTTKRGKA